MRRLSLALVLAASTLACRAGEPDRLQLDIALDKTSVARDDSVRISLTLTNASLRPVNVMPAEAYGICNHAFQVHDALQREVSVMTAFCIHALSIAIPQPVALYPGEQIVIRDWWKPADSRLDGQPIAPGAYRVRGRAAAAERFVVSDDRTVIVEQ